METKFASAKRSSPEKVREDYQLFKDLNNVREIFNSLPYLMTILNEDRQIVYINEKFLKSLKVDSIDTILGLRTGESVNCIHSKEEPGGCGTSESCRYCGAINTILESQETRKIVQSECRILSKANGNNIALDFLVSASPFFASGRHYTLLTLHDISGEKWKKALERIFFHDIMNTAGNIKGILDIIDKIDNENEFEEFIEMARKSSRMLVEEIQAQRDLLAAEAGDLYTKRKPVLTGEIMKDVTQSIMLHSVAKNKTVVIDKDSANLTFSTDGVLLKRVLTNMLKNALEAEQKDCIILFTCRFENNSVTFGVHNNSFIPRDVELQIFKRNYSSKGIGRGLGTYSMKLLAERFLGGKVWFETDKEKGTTFFVKIPISDDK